MDKDELRAKAHALKPVVNVGKNGLNENLLENITKNLTANKLTKIKILPSAAEEKERRQAIIDEILSATKATLIQETGHIVVLWKR